MLIKKLRKILRKIIIQGNYSGMVEIYSEIYKAMFVEFTEDNTPTRIGFMNELQQKGIDKAKEDIRLMVVDAEYEAYKKV